MSAPEGSGTSDQGGTLVSVQYLRGAAALIVMVFHIFSNRIAAPWGGAHGVALGMWGVDIFFVLSGFIMWRTARGSASASRFLLRRAVRIFPLYWIVLTLWIAARFIVPDGLGNADVTPRTVALSFLLVPHVHAVYGAIWPILTAGWTLQLELFFYAAFALVLYAAPPPWRLRVLLAVLCGLAALGLATTPEAAAARTYTSPLLLEFAAGLLLGAGVERLAALRPAVAFALVAAGIGAALLLCRLGTIETLRPLVLGVPAVAVVAGMLGREARFRLAPNRFWLGLGDASYALYLTHPLSIAVAALLWHRLGLPETGPAALVFVPAAALLAIAGGLFCHRLVEAPLLRLIPRRRPAARARPVPAARPAVVL
ncbi:acyltransferase [Methylobacterium sp. NEAU K]|uniref:acyltransferase family protein n=1 Tax=Methylobacterium sp. NEAU K TaxID=3064946 RepID=UPI0027347FEA|nr:acyltransferase [Methylobacterium sp. NEAU K]MDP4006130.1 acyltransferase [Methylobacterium sp. NEAU K]